MSLNYKRAGVDIEKANLFVDGIRGLVQKSQRREVMGGIGGFGAFFDLAKAKYKDPVLVSSCDGVGTKLKIAIAARIHHTVGIDLVAMSVNDVLCSGAEPLFFLDYIATGKIEPSVLKDVVRGIADGCRQANCALVGGETAEMPGMYKSGDYDLAGFCVGIVEKKKILGSPRVALGDAVIGLESSGLHSNGFSLVRKAFTPLELRARAQDFLKPTRIYVRPVLSVLKAFNASSCNVKALAHITGGAFYDKASRAVPSKTTMIIYKNAWARPAIFEELQHLGKIDEKEMFRTFNMGIGMVVVVRDAVKMDIVRAFSRHGVKAAIIGEIVSGVGGVAVV
ncbi:MAG: phosphoribosylformylglycinamidine cyclo-ligase [Candidatus Omnitrophica bacterium]|nr:phosphoribosylformylglycinamidine cyclo-ligase [Candidatus Omnitrophota bacterium]MDD5137895.1 phosphoribosylformylglycinamidine cyclo-ligase [Candidatus Omnitrophota bacterium]MDD5537888.1 phosphoribosylformylglycinamidine cyclo-ligase [Candidatus Omnitrophota bacterium]